MLAASLTLNPRRVPGLLLRLRFVTAAAYAAGLMLDAIHGGSMPAWTWLVPAALLAVNVGLLRGWDDNAAATPFCLSVQLSGDALALFVLLWASGGATNPFVSLFLVPVAIAGVTLPARHAAALTGWCMVGYTVLLLRYLRDGSAHGAMTGFEHHVVGMWLNFVLAAILLCVFLLAVSAALRARARAGRTARAPVAGRCDRIGRHAGGWGSAFAQYAAGHDCARGGSAGYASRSAG